MWKKKLIQTVIAFLLIFAMGIMTFVSGNSVVHAEDTGTIEAEEQVEVEDTYAGKTARDVLQLDEELMQFVGIGREAIENYGISLFSTADGDVVTITPGNTHYYGSWATCEFQISTGQIGFCAEPNSDTPSGQFQAYKLNNDVVKALLMVAHGGPLFSQEFWDQLGQNPSCVQPDGHNDAYSLAHACIGVTYSGSVAGLSEVDIQEVNTLIDRAYQSAIKTSEWHNYTAYVAPNDQQDIVWLEYTPPQNGYVELVKTSANPEISDQNDCYSLKDAEYGVYSDANCKTLVTTLVTDEKGSAKSGELSIGNYWVKEIKAPKGYAKDLTVYPVTVNSSVAVKLNVTDYPQSDPVSILLGKVDKETNTNKPQGSASLAGAEFTVKYYQGFYDTDPAAQGVKAERTWVLKTNEEGKTILNNEYLVSGDEFYINSKGVPIIPLGTVTIQETKSPEGYLINEETFVRQITAGGTAESVETYNAPTVLEQSLDLNIVKKIKGTEIVIPGVVFKHTLPDGTTEMITTDEEGKASVKGLTWGTHTIEEESVPDGFTKNPGKITFTVAEDNSIEMTGNTSAEETGNMTFTVNEDGSAGLTVEDTYAPYKLILKKNNEKGTLLEGAEFTLYSDPECKTEVAKATTGKDGTLEFTGLQVETKYYLKETKAPEGYRIPVNADGSEIVIEIYTKSNPLENVFEYYVNGEIHTETTGDYAITGTKAERIVNLTVINQTGKKLPETGTHMTLMITLLGIGCMTIATIKKKKTD